MSGTQHAFLHPEPLAINDKIRPVFLPFAGCTNTCIYCSQHAVTGQQKSSLEKSIRYTRRLLQDAVSNNSPAMELGFYGGTFTALPAGWPQRFIAVAKAFQKNRVVSAIRCSTRPDAISKTLLLSLKKQGLNMVELGIQSFDEKTLQASKRGYTSKQALQACKTVQEAGLELGIQLMPGLPGPSDPSDQPGPSDQSDQSGHNPQAFQQDIARTIALKPQAVRLYPCQVLKHTKLATWWQQGLYTPWDRQTTVELLGQATYQLWKAGINIIRTGLPASDTLEQQTLAGPRHPALGQLIRSQALFLFISSHCDSPGRPCKLYVPPKYYSDVIGHKKSMLPAYTQLGITPENITRHDRHDFILQKN